MGCTASSPSDTARSFDVAVEFVKRAESPVSSDDVSVSVCGETDSDSGSVGGDGDAAAANDAPATTAGTASAATPTPTPPPPAAAAATGVFSPASTAGSVCSLFSPPRVPLGDVVSLHGRAEVMEHNVGVGLDVIAFLNNNGVSPHSSAAFARPYFIDDTKKMAAPAFGTPLVRRATEERPPSPPTNAQQPHQAKAQQPPARAGAPAADVGDAQTAQNAPAASSGGSAPPSRAPPVPPPAAPSRPTTAPPPVPAPAAPAAGKTQAFRRGDRVDAKLAKWKTFYPGTIARVSRPECNSTGMFQYAVLFDDGDRQNVPATGVRKAC